MQTENSISTVEKRRHTFPDEVESYSPPIEFIDDCSRHRNTIHPVGDRERAQVDAFLFLKAGFS